MTRLTPQSWKTLDRIFRKAGFEYKGKKKGHRKYKKAGHLYIISMPEHNKDIRVGLIDDLLEKAGISKKEYFELLKKNK